MSIFRFGRNNFQLAELAAYFGPAHLQLLPSPLQFQGAEFGADDDGRYVVTVRGRMEVDGRVPPFVYQRALRVRSGSEPGRPARVITTLTDGMAKIRGANVRPFAATLDEAIMATVHKVFWEAAKYVAWYGLYIHGTPFEATTVSVNRITFEPHGSSEGTEGYAYVTAGAITGGFTQQEPLITT